MNALALTGGTLWLGDGRSFDGHVTVQNGRIAEVAEGSYAGDLATVDLGGMSLSPGMVDLMVLGGFDRSILRDDPLAIAREYVRLGVTSCQFCTGTLPWESLERVAENARSARSYHGNDSASVVGVYLEGPFQEPHLTGASLKEYALDPTDENTKRILEMFGDVLTMINVAPGLEGSDEAVAGFREAGVVVSMAHSDAAVENVFACVDAGTSVLGHCWDNNSGRIGNSGVQQPTIEHVALTDERVRAIHLICDGVHAHPVMVRLILRARGAETICLVTDAVTRAGMPDGEYTADDGRTFRKEGGVGRTDTGWLCGSATLLPDMFRNFVEFTGVAPPEAVRTVTGNPAASIGLSGEFGLLATGRRADFVAWDEKLMVKRVWKGGHEIDDVSDFAEVSI